MLTSVIVVVVALAVGAYYHTELSAYWAQFKAWVKSKE